MKEKLFGLVSLGFLTVGFIVGVAGADKDGPKDLAHATDQLIQHVTYAKEAEEINRSQTVIGVSDVSVSNKNVSDDKIAEKSKITVVTSGVPNDSLKVKEQKTLKN